MVSAAAVFLSAFLLGMVLLNGAGWICAWRELTGLPCAGCGGTRSFLLLLSGRWLDALQMNPGAVVGVLVVFLANLYAAAVLVFRLDPWRPSVPAWRWLVGAGLASNWLYLLLVSRP